MKKSNSLFLLVLWLVFATVSAPSQMLVARHIGSNDPTSEGFNSASFGSPQVAGIANDMGFATWSTSVSSAGIYYFRQLPSLAGLDWELSTTIRVATPNINPQGYAFESSIQTGTDYFVMSFGSDAQGNQIITAGGGGYRPVITVDGAGSTYHNYRLAYQAATDTASLWIDGAERFVGLTGLASSSTRLDWQSGYQSPGNLTANWNEVSVTIIPEPPSLALCLTFIILTASRITHIRRRARIIHPRQPLPGAT